jgi:hypothetical protein
MKKLIIIGLLCSSSVFAQTWTMSMSDTGNTCDYSILNAKNIYTTVISKVGGYTKCKMFKPEKNADLIICTEPSFNVWMSVENLAICNKYKEMDKTSLYLLLLRYLDCANEKCTFKK